MLKNVWIQKKNSRMYKDKILTTILLISSIRNGVSEKINDFIKNFILSPLVISLYLVLSN